MELSDPILIAAATEAVDQATDPNVLGTLGINWKLFLAQLVNFAIVLFVLWKWVFGPVAGALEKRRERIESSLKEAKQIEERIEAFEQEHEERLKKSREEAEAIIQKSMETANKSKTETIEEARAEAERILLNARETIEAEKDSAIKEVRQEVAELTLLCAEKVIQEKLTEQKDKDLVTSVLKDI